MMNSPPVFDALAGVTVNEGATATQNLSATDVDGDPLVFSLVTAPPYVSLMGASVVNIAPTFDDSGTAMVTVRVSDGQHQVDASFMVTVNNVNRAPVVMPISTVSMTAGTTQQVTLVGTDPDGDVITWSLTNAPAFAMLSGNVITFSPAANVVDARMMTATATDPSNATGSQSFQLTVTAPPNQPPTLSLLEQLDSMNVVVPPGSMVAAVPQLRATVDDPENAQVRLDAEVVVTGSNFTDTATHTGVLTAEGQIVLPLSSLAPGNYKWQLRARDASGAASAWQAFSSGGTAFTLVAGSVSGTVVINSGAVATNNATVSLTLTSSTGAPATVTEMCFSNDGVNFIDCGPPLANKSWPLAAGDGSKTVSVRIRNSVNQTTIVSDTIVLDVTPPQLSSFVVNSNAAATNVQTVSLSWTASDATSGVASQSASNDGSTFSSISSSPAVWMLSTTQGQVTVTLRVIDAAGNQATATDTIFFDTATPTISSAVINSGAAWTNSTSASLALTAADGATSSGFFQVCVSGNVTPGCVPYAASVPITLSGGNGSKTVLITVSDNAGNVSLASMASIGLDQTTPSLSGLNVNTSAVFTNSATVSVASFANDSGGSGLAQIQCQTDSGAFSAPITWAATVMYALQGADGLKTVGCRVIDAAGNVSAGVATDTITLDRGAPTGTFVINVGNPQFTNALGVTLQLTASDLSGVTHYCANLTGTPPTGPGDACFTPMASTNFNLFAPDGSKTIAVWFRDGANNVSTSPALDSITLDTAAPILSVMGPGLGIAAGAAGTNSLMPIFSHSASDGVSGLSQVCTGTTSPPMNCVAYTLTPTLSLTAGDGMKTGFIRVIDGAGNPSAILSDTITLDQTAPMLSMVNVNGGAAWTNSISVSVSSTASDAIGIAQLQLSNTGPGGYGTAIAYVTPTPHTLSTGDGMKTVTMRVLDSAGNPSTDVQDSIGLDTTPPTTTISINTGASYTQTASVSVGWTPVETGSGLSQLCLKETAVGAAAPATPTAADPCFVAYATPAMFSLTAQGNRRLYGWLLDLAGNVSIAAATDDIFFDSVVPTVPTGPSATAGHRLVTLTFTNATDAASGVQGYEIGTSLVTGGPYVFGSIIMPQVGMTTSVPLTLPNGVQQFLVVRTVDNAGNRSANSTQVTATPRWPFTSQNRPASGAQVRDLAFHAGTSRYFTAGANGALYSSDLTLSTFTRRDPMTDQTLNGLLIDSAGDVWTVGRQGHISRSTDDGVTFEVLPNADTSMPQRDLNQLTFAGTTGSILVTSWWVAVGNAGRIVRAGTSTLNNAPSFSVITTSTSANLNSVTRCASASGPCSTGGVLIAVGTVGTVLRSTDNGATWTSVTLPAGYTTTLNAVAALPNSNTVFIGAVSPAGQGALLRSVDGGQAFVELSGFGDLTEITALSALGADLWATGRIGTTAATLRLTGNTRTDATLPAPSSQNVTQVGLFARTATDVVSGGSNGDMMQMTGALTFTKKNLGVTTSFINKMSMPPTFGSTAWAVGGGGLILFTSNAGTTWTQQAAGLTPNTITSVEAFDTGGGVAATLLFGVGAGGQIYKSTNGGTTWAFDPDNGIVAASLTDVACRTATSCLAVGSASTVLTWSGSNWVVTSTGGPRVFNAVAAYVSSGVNRAVVVGNGGALQTQSGTTWTPRPDINAAVDFRGLAAKNDSTGVLIAVGTTGAIYKSIDHGATFTVRTSGVTATLEDVSHVVGTSVWYASGGVGTLVKSIDDGETWVRLVTNSTDNLLAVCTGSIASRVWVGGNGTALLFSPTAGQ